jgi:hypothetical protein
MSERGRGLRETRDVIEAICRARGHGDIRVDFPPVDEDLVLALAARKAHDATADFLVRDPVFGVAAIALEFHRLHRMWASALICAVSSLASTES